MKSANQYKLDLKASGNVQGVFLAQHLDYFRPWLDDPLITEICVNRPQELWIEHMGAHAMECIINENITHDMLQRLGRLIASFSAQSIAQDKPLLSAILPTGERVQIALPPVARYGVALSIRKQGVQDLSLPDFVKAGVYDEVKLSSGQEALSQKPPMPEFASSKDVANFLAQAVQSRKNILIAGGTSSGKTTQLNALLKEISAAERIVTIEDTPELNPLQKNHLSLIASKGNQGTSPVSIQDCLEASLRFRPDRILLGELRGKEAYAYLRAVNTGHPGSITTVHADTPKGALEQITLMVMQAGLGLNRQEIIDYTSAIIDIVIQLKRSGGKRILTDIWCP